MSILAIVLLVAVIVIFLRKDAIQAEITERRQGIWMHSHDRGQP